MIANLNPYQPSYESSRFPGEQSRFTTRHSHGGHQHAEAFCADDADPRLQTQRRRGEFVAGRVFRGALQEAGSRPGPHHCGEEQCPGGVHI